MSRMRGFAGLVLAVVLSAGATHGLMAQAAAAETPVRSVPDLQQACDADEAAACLSLSSRYAYGREVPRDPARAGDLLRRSEALYLQRCVSGESSACEIWVFDISIRHGLTTQEDPRELAIDLRSGCSAGVPESCLAWAFMREPAPDDGSDVELFRETCDQGSGLGCFALVLEIAFTSIDLDEDESRSLDGILERSCDLGFHRACE